MLQLGLVVPSVPRTVNGQPAAVTWWLDDVLMSEQERPDRFSHIPAHPLITQHARSNQAVLPGVSADARGEPRRPRRPDDQPIVESW